MTDIKECVTKAICKSRVDFEVETDFCTEPTVIEGDEYHITESLICVINNAYEAVSERIDSERFIRVSVGQEEKYIYINIIDNGCGISRKNLAAVFKPFYSTKRGGENYGLGLSYVKQVANAHSGDVYIKSRPEHGTIVQITFSNNQEKRSMKWEK